MLRAISCRKSQTGCANISETAHYCVRVWCSLEPTHLCANVLCMQVGQVWGGKSDRVGRSLKAGYLFEFVILPVLLCK